MVHPKFKNILRVLLAIVPVAVVAQAQSTAICSASKEHPVQVCFDPAPLVINHCKGEIELHFQVGLFPFDNGELPPYYFTYQIVKDGVARETQNPLQNKFLLSQPDPFSQLGDAASLVDYDGLGQYSVNVSVFAQGREAVTFASPTVPLDDPVHVVAVVIGVSTYTSQGIPQLLHPDEDARSVDAFLKAVFPTTLTETLFTSDSADPARKPTVKNISDAMASEAQAPHACSVNDWFIFYFSGHGIVGSNEATVGSRGAVATHYLSTNLLDPGNLDGTAIPIEHLFSWIRDIKSGNKIVVLDSCFSGSSKQPLASSPGGQSGKSAINRRKSLKVAYIYKKSFVDPYDFENRNPRKGNGDLLVFDSTPKQEEADSKRALYLSASASDHEAEEGFEQYSDKTLSFYPSDDETDEQKPFGHGLYTFVFLWNLISQLPKNSLLPEILKGQSPAANAVGTCTLDFSSAHQLGAADIIRLSLDANASGRQRDYQKPEVAGHTQTTLPSISCQIQTKGEGATGRNEMPK